MIASVPFEDSDVLRRPGVGLGLQRFREPCQAGLVEIGIVGLGEYALALGRSSHDHYRHGFGRGDKPKFELVLDRYV